MKFLFVLVLALAVVSTAEGFTVNVEPGCLIWTLDAAPTEQNNVFLLTGEQTSCKNITFLGNEAGTPIHGEAYLVGALVILRVWVPVFLSAHEQEYVVLLNPNTYAGTSGVLRGSATVVP